MTMRARWLAILVVVGLGFTGLSTPWSGAWRGAWGSGPAQQPAQRPGSTMPVAIPGVPTNLAASVGEDDLVHLSWSAGSPAGSSYQIWRGFGGDKTLIGTSSSTTYVDEEPVYGSPAWYAVAAVNGEGGASDLSAEDDAWPVMVKTYRRPFYFLMQAGDYPDGSQLTQAQVDSLAKYDCVEFAPHQYERGGAQEQGYIDLVERIRASAAADDGHDVVALTYFFANAARLDWAPTVVTHPTKGPYGPYAYTRTDVFPRIYDCCAANNGFMKGPTGQVVVNPQFPVYNYNYGNFAIADSIAKIVVRGQKDSGLDGEYTGFLYDFANSDIQTWTVGSLSNVDLDQDGRAYNYDAAETAQELALYRGWHLHLLQALRREFGERGMSNRLIVVNGNGVQNLDELAAYCDGYMEERWNDDSNGYPGWRQDTDLTSAWQAVLGDYADHSRFPHAQTRPYAFMYHCYADSALAEMSESLAVATDGWAHANAPGYHYGCYAPGTYDCWTRACNGERRIGDPLVRLPAPGVVSGYTISNTAFTYPETFHDTLTVNTAAYSMKLVLRPTVRTNGVWPYLVVAADGDTLRRGGGWPRQAYSAPPPAAPVAAFSASTTSPCVEQTVSFTDQSTNTPTSWAWTFGDGGTSDSSAPDHAYDTAGTYTVTLTATNGSGSDGETKTNYITVGECSVVITGTDAGDDTFDEGESVAVLGTGFGTKTTAAPIKYADFESGSQGAVITTSEGWNSVDGWHSGSSSHLYRPIHDSAAAHTGARGMTCRYVDGVYNSSVLKAGDFSGGYYFDAWYKYAPANPPSRNHKIWMLYGSGTGEFPQAAMTGFCGLDDSIEIPFYAGPNDGDAEWMGVHFNDLTTTMHHIQVWLKPSTPGTGNGRAWCQVDCTSYANSSDLLTVMPNIGDWQEVRVGYYMAHDAIGDCVASGDAYTYFDDVYIDNTPARVELGNANAYDACTIREIQVPTAWSATSVSIQSRWGALLSAEKAFLFVIDNQGYVSAGYQVYHN